MLRIEVNSNKENDKFRTKVSAKEPNTLEAIYVMAVAYYLIKKNDETGLTDKDLEKEVKNLYKRFIKEDKEI